MSEVKEYKITQEHCQKMINDYGGVCSQCGGKLTPIETVDNSGAPTFWSGCEPCQRFDYGTKPIIFQIARDMVLNQYYIHYRHLDSPAGKADDYKDYWQKAQIAGACGLVKQILNTHKKLTGSKEEVWQEEARQYAESEMPNGWDRKDQINIGIFYGHYIDYIEKTFSLFRKS